MIRLGLASFVFLTPLVVGCAASTSSDDSSSGSKDDGGGGVMAQIMCEKFVKDRLKSPATAEFSEQRHKDTRYGYRVTGVVDSENGFGAMLRSDYGCDIKYVGKDKWRAKSVEVNAR